MNPGRRSLPRFSDIPVLTDLDVLVIGAGSAGCCAAIAAGEALAANESSVPRESVASVGLVERYGFAGGTSTQILDTFYGFFTPGDTPRKVVGGIPDAVVDTLDRTDDIFLRPNTYGAGTGVTYNPERLKFVWDTLLQNAGVQTLLHATLVDVVMESSVITGVIVSTKSGFFRINAKRFIDASGDADLCHLADIPYEKAGELDPAQTLTTTFRMSGVDLARYDDAGGKTMLNQQMEQAFDAGTHPLPRKHGSAHAMVQDGCIATVAVRVADLDATDFQQLGDAEREGRRQAFVYETFLRDCIPGYENAKIIGLSNHIGVRETRRVYGNHRLTREQCLTGQSFDDAIALCGAPIEDHRASPDSRTVTLPGCDESGKPTGKAVVRPQQETAWAYVENGGVYGVPYGTLVPKGRDEVWVVGRCFSATHDAHASCRSMGQTMSMGQAAGLAAVQSLRDDAGASQIDTVKLRETLHRRGAVLEFPESTANIECWSENRVS